MNEENSILSPLEVNHAVIFLTNSIMKFFFFPLLLKGGGIKRWLRTGGLLALIGSAADPIWLKRMGAIKSLAMGVPMIFYILRRVGSLSFLRILWSLLYISIFEYILHTWVISREKEAERKDIVPD